MAEESLCKLVTKHFKTYGRENVSKLCNSISDGLSYTAVINCDNSVYHLFKRLRNLHFNNEIYSCLSKILQPYIVLTLFSVKCK